MILAGNERSDTEQVQRRRVCWSVRHRQTQKLLSPDDADLWARSIDRLVEDAALLRRWRDDQAATAMRLRFDWNQSFCSIIEADTPLRGAT